VADKSNEPIQQIQKRRKTSKTNNSKGTTTPGKRVTEAESNGSVLVGGESQGPQQKNSQNEPEITKSNNLKETTRLGEQVTGAESNGSMLENRELQGPQQKDYQDESQLELEKAASETEDSNQPHPDEPDTKQRRKRKTNNSKQTTTVGDQLTGAESIGSMLENRESNGTEQKDLDDHHSELEFEIAATETERIEEAHVDEKHASENEFHQVASRKPERQPEPRKASGTKANPVFLDDTTVKVSSWPPGAHALRPLDTKYIELDPVEPLPEQMSEYLIRFCHGRMPSYAKNNMTKAIDKMLEEKGELQFDSVYPIGRSGIGALLMSRDLLQGTRKKGQEWWINDDVIMSYSALLQRKHADCLIVPFTVYASGWNSATTFRKSFVSIETCLATLILILPSQTYRLIERS